MNECHLFRKRKAKVCIPFFDRPCTFYDAILPLRVLLLKIHAPRYHPDLLPVQVLDHADLAV